MFTREFEANNQIYNIGIKQALLTASFRQNFKINIMGKVVMPTYGLKTAETTADKQDFDRKIDLREGYTMKINLKNTEMPKITKKELRNTAKKCPLSGIKLQKESKQEKDVVRLPRPTSVKHRPAEPFEMVRFENFGAV